MNKSNFKWSEKG